MTNDPPIVDNSAIQPLNQPLNQPDGNGTNNGGNGAESVMKIDASKVKLPEFLPGNVDMWFWQVESAFIAADIKADAKKYHSIIGQLPSTVIMKLADFRTNPPIAGQMYASLKEKITKEYADSEQTKIEKLLEDMPLGDRKPSELLNDMRTKAANTPVNDDLLRQLWMRNLPETIRAILSTDDTSPLTTKAAMADKIHEATRKGLIGRSINEVSASKSQPQIVNITPASQQPGNYSDLAQIVASLTNEVKQLRMSQRQSRSKTPARQNTNSKSNSSQDNSSQGANGTEKRNFDYCWWHYKHGANAQKCKQPCNYKEKNSSEN